MIKKLTVGTFKTYFRRKGLENYNEEYVMEMMRDAGYPGIGDTSPAPKQTKEELKDEPEEVMKFEDGNTPQTREEVSPNVAKITFFRDDLSMNSCSGSTGEQSRALECTVDFETFCQLMGIDKDQSCNIQFTSNQ